jgi:hypothetical protein
VAVLATTDLGDEHVLLAPTELAPGTWVDVARWAPEPGEGRVTVWVALVPAGAPPALRTLADLEALVRAGTASVVAARWSDARDP